MPRSNWIEYDAIGRYRGRPDTASMTSPVRCARCPGVYDLGTVEVVARYADCSMWRTPCCGQTVDDRGETGWRSTRDYYRLGQVGVNSTQS